MLSSHSRIDSPFDAEQGNGNTHLRADSQGASSMSPDINGARRPKQKRNKPTLSCRECVDRKTKVPVVVYGGL